MKDYPILGLVGVHYVGDRPMSMHSGKDEFCTAFIQSMLPEGYQVVRRGFADSLKEDLARMLNITVDQINQNKQAFRLMMQGYGTDYARALFGSDYWVRRLDAWVVDDRESTRMLEQASGLRYGLIVSDCRMHNEIEYVKQQGGVVVRITRRSPADYPVPEGHRNHSSEVVEGLDFDYEIENIDLQLFRIAVNRFTRKVFLPQYYEKRRKLGNGCSEGQAVPRSFESGGASE